MEEAVKAKFKRCKRRVRHGCDEKYAARYKFLITVPEHLH